MVGDAEAAAGMAGREGTEAEGDMGEMNGIYVEIKDKMLIALLCGASKSKSDIILTLDKASTGIPQRYRTVAKRDRAWAMLENAIATGVRLFRFPTDEELEKGWDE